MISHASPQAPATIRPCGFTRRELRNLRACSGLKRPYKVRAWLLKETELAAWADPKTKRLAAVYSSAIDQARALLLRRAAQARHQQRVADLVGHQSFRLTPEVRVALQILNPFA